MLMMAAVAVVAKVAVAVAVAEAVAMLVADMRRSSSIGSSSMEQPESGEAAMIRGRRGTVQYTVSRTLCKSVVYAHSPR